MHTTTPASPLATPHTIGLGGVARAGQIWPLAPQGMERLMGAIDAWKVLPDGYETPLPQGSMAVVRDGEGAGKIVIGHTATRLLGPLVWGEITDARDVQAALAATADVRIRRTTLRTTAETSVALAVPATLLGVLLADALQVHGTVPVAAPTALLWATISLLSFAFLRARLRAAVPRHQGLSR